MPECKDGCRLRKYKFNPDTLNSSNDMTFYPPLPERLDQSIRDKSLEALNNVLEKYKAFNVEGEHPDANKYKCVRKRKSKELPRLKKGEKEDENWSKWNDSEVEAIFTSCGITYKVVTTVKARTFDAKEHCQPRRLGKVVFNERKRPEFQWDFIRLLLLAVLGLGFFSIVRPSFQSSFPYSFLSAISAFSIAFAIHYFAVSIGINGVYIRESDPNKRSNLRDIEYDIVTSAMCVLSGGLIILLAGGIGIFLQDHRIILSCVYCFGAAMLFFGTLRYTRWQRSWPRKAQKIIENHQ